MLIIEDPTDATEVLLVHAPYPGRLKFDGAPSSLLSAFTPLASQLAERGELSKLGILDPRAADDAFYDRLSSVVRQRSLRVACVSTSTVAIEETAKIVQIVRELGDRDLLLIVGGPHEDDIDEKVAVRIGGVDLSLGGEVEHVLAALIQRFLRRVDAPARFVRDLGEQPADLGCVAGQGTLSSRHWPEPFTRLFDRGAIPLDSLPARAHATRPIRFNVFDAEFTVPLMVSRGCTYGQCTFCAEGAPGLRARVQTEFGWIRDVVERNPGAALYFQDSIIPTTPAVRTKLLPMLRELGVEWGCQVYLPTMSRRWLAELAATGCRYLYTGLESASAEILTATGKSALDIGMAIERLMWTADQRVLVGLSLMFGAMRSDGATLETDATIDATLELVAQIRGAGVRVAGVYPNVETVLPRTALARNLGLSGSPLDFYSVPRCDAFRDLEDGGYGHNFATLRTSAESRGTGRLVERIAEASRSVAAKYSRAGDTCFRKGW